MNVLLQKPNEPSTQVNIKPQFSRTPERPNVAFGA
jgi:hypothetical protein